MFNVCYQLKNNNIKVNNFGFDQYLLSDASNLLE